MEWVLYSLASRGKRANHRGQTFPKLHGACFMYPQFATSERPRLGCGVKSLFLVFATWVNTRIYSNLRQGLPLAGPKSPPFSCSTDRCVRTEDQIMCIYAPLAHEDRL